MKWFKVLAVLALLLLAVSVGANVAWADGPTSESERVADSQVTSRHISPLRSATQSSGSWSWEYANAAASGIDSYGRKVVQHYYGRTRKLTGTGTYKAEVHSTLLNGGTYGSPSVFDYLQYPCAKQEKVNATAQSCPSPWFVTTTGRKWFIITGHYFDIGADGLRDGTCDGGIDWVYTTP